MALLMMVTAGENMGKKRFMDPKILGDYHSFIIWEFQSFNFSFAIFAKSYVSVFVYRAYYRCTHRFTQDCLAVKQVQKSDTDPSLFEVKYLGNHTCNNITSPKTTTNFSVSLTNTNIFEGNRVHVTEQSEDMKPTKSEEVMISLEDLENKKNIFRTFSFSNHEIENGVWKSNLFLGNFVEDLSPATSGSAITSEVLSAPAAVENSETADSYFSSLDNIIDFGQDWLWS